MRDTLQSCPRCGKHIIAGAMRCVSCGSITKTPEEQIASIERLQQSGKKLNVTRLIKCLIAILALSLLYHFYSEEIIQLISRTFGL